MKNTKRRAIILLLIIVVIAGLLFLGKRIFSKKDNENVNNLTTDAEANNQKDYENQEIIEDQSENNSVDREVETENKELFSKYYDKAEELMATMSLEDKVGQMFLARYPGTSAAINEIKSYGPGGYVLFGVDFKSKNKEQVIKELENDQSSSKIKLLLAVDEEGGTVTRVSSYKNFRASKFKSPQALNKEGGMEAILNDSKEKSELLKSLGLNMNLCPVVDIPTSSSSFIYSRSYGKTAEETAKYSSELIKEMNKDNMIASMKHFPGYGDNVDTHTGIAIDKRAYSVFEESEFLPFISGIEQGCPTILVNHNIINCMDSEKPASLSENVHKVLRADLNFSGLVITDDLAMDAVKSYVENGEAAAQAVIAGNDMIISSDFKKQRAEVLNAVKEGKISEETINIAVKRILACKYYYGIIE